MSKIDEYFTKLTDQVTESVGNWKASAMAIIAVLCWFIAGPFMGWSDTWQLYINTPTTIVEMFLGLWSLSSQNRVEKHIFEMLENIKQLVAKEKEEIEEWIHK